MRHLRSSTGWDTSRESRLWNRALFAAPSSERTTARTISQRAPHAQTQIQRTPPVNQASHMADVGHHGGLASSLELSEGKVEGFLEALVGRGLVLAGIVGHDAHEKLVQCVLYAFVVE